MKVTTEELEHCEVLLTIEFDAAKEQDLLKKAAKRIAREVNIPGYRPGKAPYNTIVRRFGLETVRQEAFELLDDKVIEDALKQANITPYAKISLDEVSWDPLVLKLKVPTEPVVELGDYRQIRLESEPVEVTDEDIEESLKSLQEQHATWVPVDRPAQIGDLISMTVTERDGDQILYENEAVEYELKEPAEGEEAKQPDLTTPLIGLSAGESKTFTVTYPEDYGNPDYAGKEITVSVEVSGVKEKTLDPLDDDFARMVSDFETLDELKEKIRQDLLEERQRSRDAKLGSEALDKLVETATIKWPPALEEQEVQEEIEYTERRLKDMGLALDDYLAMQNKTREAWIEEIRQGVVNRLKRGLVLGKVAELEGLEVSQSEILEEAKSIADYTGGGEALWRALIASPAQQNRIVGDLMSNKALFRLAAIARGEAPDLDAQAASESIEADESAESAADDSGPATEASDSPDAEANAVTPETETVVETDADSVEKQE